jgi:predicted metal-dependent phosphoesterase TrpH
LKVEADLHSHTTASDGLLAPEELVRQARARGLRALAITDHDTLAGYESVASTRHGLDLIPGVELSCDGPEGEVHILGYFVNASSSELARALGSLLEARRRRVRRILDALAAAGVTIHVDVEGQGSLGRPHVARALVSAGHAKSLRDAFARYLTAGGPGHVPYETGLDPARAIRLVRDAGGVSSLAHPPASAAQDGWLATLAAAGLQAVEARHPRHSETDSESLRKAARELGLEVTGGSDFHGTPDEGAQLGDFGLTLGDLEKLRTLGRSP